MLTMSIGTACGALVAIIATKNLARDKVQNDHTCCIFHNATPEDTKPVTLKQYREHHYWFIIQESIITGLLSRKAN